MHPKLDARSRAGIYLRQLPIHNRNVALVLNIHTGYVSPQFHVKFDESFRTVLQHKWDATWLSSTGFTKSSNRISHDEDIKTPEKRHKSTERQPVPNGEIRDHPWRRQMAAVTNEVFLSTKDAASTDGCDSGLHAGKRSEGKVSLPLCSLTIWCYRYALMLPIAEPDLAFSWHSELNTSLGTTTRNHDSEPHKSIRSP